MAQTLHGWVWKATRTCSAMVRLLNAASVLDGAGDNAPILAATPWPHNRAAAQAVRDACQRRHSAMFHSSLSQPLMRTPRSVSRCADTEPRTTSGIS